jgi:hypothetical protein
MGEVEQNFLSGAEQEGGQRGATFSQDNRWILGGRSAGKYTGGRLQFRDVERAELCSEVIFPPSLGSLYEFPTLPDGRVMTKFVARRRSGEFDTHYFLWHVEDLLNYGSKH